MSRLLTVLATLALGISVLAPSFVLAQSGTGMLWVYVQVINQTGGTQVPGNFIVSVQGGNPSPASFPGSQSGIQVNVGGSYSVVASTLSGFTPVYSQGCTGTLSMGAQATCVITESGASQYNQYPTPYPYPYTPQPLTCSPSYQTVAPGQTAHFTATGGVGSYNWRTASQNFLNVGPSFNTVLPTVSTQSVIVSSGAQSASCTVAVIGGGVISYGNPTLTQSYLPRVPNTGFEPAGAAAAAFALVLLIAAGIVSAPYVRKVIAAGVN